MKAEPSVGCDVMKRPAGANVMKRPAVAVEIVAPKPSQRPTLYNGGRIYHSAKKQQFRVYLKCGDKIEKLISHVSFENSNRMKRQWREALRMIDADRLERP